MKTNQVMLNGEVITVCSQVHTKHTNSLCVQNIAFLTVNIWCVTLLLGLKGLRTLTSQYLHLYELNSLHTLIKVVQMVQYC